MCCHGLCGWSVSSTARLPAGVFLERRARIDRDLDPAILLTACFGVVRPDRLALTEPRGRDIATDTVRPQVPSRGFRAPNRETLVVVPAADRVRVTGDH